MRIQSLLFTAVVMAFINNATADTAPADVEIKDLVIENSLTGSAGDPAEGRKVFADRKLGNCLACHANSEMADQQFHGEVGPSLDGCLLYTSDAADE